MPPACTSPLSSSSSRPRPPRPSAAHAASRIPSPPRTPHHQCIRCARGDASSRPTPSRSDVSHRPSPAVVLDASARAHLIPPTVSAAHVARFPFLTSPFSVSLCTPTPSSCPPSPHIGLTSPIRRPANPVLAPHTAVVAHPCSPTVLNARLRCTTHPLSRILSTMLSAAAASPTSAAASELPARILRPMPETTTSPVATFNPPRRPPPCTSVPKCDHRQDASPTVILRERARELGKTVPLYTHAGVKESWIFSCGPASHAFTSSYIFLSFFLSFSLPCYSTWSR
jgi:hypothetical protein